MSPESALPPGRRTRYAVIFDLDGTLLDTAADLATSANAALAELGAPPHPVEAYKRFVGDGVEVLLQRALPAQRRDSETVARGVALMRAHYGRHWHDQTRPYPGIAELLATLAARAARLAVLSNKPHDPAVQTIRHFFPTVPFAKVVGARPGVPHKPDPTAALALARDLEVAAADCWLVGDSGSDMLTARSAGMLGVGATWGFRGEAELRAHGAVVLLAAPADLLALIERR